MAPHSGPTGGPAPSAFLFVVLVLLLVGNWRLKVILVQISGPKVFIELPLHLTEDQTWCLLLGLLLFSLSVFCGFCKNF